MLDSNDTTRLKLDPVSIQIIRQQMLHSIERLSDEDLEEVERLSDEDLEEVADETTDGDQDTFPILMPTRQAE